MRSLPPNTLCLFCLMCGPQHVLRCGHTLCDICVKSIGERTTWEYCYEIQDCVYCLQLIEFRRYLKPPTCGIRALSLDGGGIRGVISLENILLFQNQLAQSSNLIFLNLFDFVVGTSAGMYFARELEPALILQVVFMPWHPIRAAPAIGASNSRKSSETQSKPTPVFPRH